MSSPGDGAGFAIDGGLALAILRGLFDAALFSLFGSAVFARMMAAGPGGRRAGAAPPAAGLWGTNLLAAVALGLAWFAAETRAISGAVDARDWLAAVPVVLTATRYGHLVAAQEAILIALLAGRIRSRHREIPMIALVATGAVLLMQVGHGHAAAMFGGGADAALLVVSDAIHLLAGGAWLGGLLPLLITIRGGDADATPAVSLRFSSLGIACVGLIAVTAFVQSAVLVGSVAALVGTAYGQVALAKTALLLLLVAIAANNRFRLTPRVGSRAGAARALASSIGAETCVGLLVLLAAGLLASLMPGMHAQAVWPFGQTLSLVTIDEDAGFRREVLLAAAAVAVAFLLAAGGVAALLLLRGSRRRRVLALVPLALSACLAGAAAPHFDLLFVQAYPTSYFRSTSGYTADAIADGAASFESRCAACHGADGAGDGPLASSLPVPPADLLDPMIRMHGDGELYWWLFHGIEGASGRLVMPGFGSVLSPAQIWSLIDFLHAREEGVAAGGRAILKGPVRLPGFFATCDGRATALGALRGHPLLVAVHPAMLADVAGLVTIRIGAAETGDDAARASCRTDDPGVAAALAIAAGRPPAAAGALQFLVGRSGHLVAAPEAPGGKLDLLQETRAALARDASAAPDADEGGMVMDPGMGM